jgi:hypothetical protein
MALSRQLPSIWRTRRRLFSVPPTMPARRTWASRSHRRRRLLLLLSLLLQQLALLLRRRLR